MPWKSSGDPQIERRDGIVAVCCILPHKRVNSRVYPDPRLPQVIIALVEQYGKSSQARLGVPQGLLSGDSRWNGDDVLVEPSAARASRDGFRAGCHESLIERHMTSNESIAGGLPVV